MADAHGNIGFNDKLTEYSLSLLAEAVALTEGVGAMLGKLYPNHDGGPADRAQRNAASAVRALKEVRTALEELSGRERASQTAQRDSEQGLGDIRGLHPAFDRPKEPVIVSGFTITDTMPWPFPVRFHEPLNFKVEVVFRDGDGVDHRPPFVQDVDKANGRVLSVEVFRTDRISALPRPLRVMILKKVKP
jgi:hypothetical protein